MDLVESHVHIWTIRDRRFGRHPDSDFTPELEAAPEDLFAAQDEVGGVAWTVLIQPRYYLWDNTYLANAAAVHPDRLVVAGRVNPMTGRCARAIAGADAVARLSRHSPGGDRGPCHALA